MFFFLGQWPVCKLLPTLWPMGHIFKILVLKHIFHVKIKQHATLSFYLTEYVFYIIFISHFIYVVLVNIHYFYISMYQYILKLFCNCRIGQIFFIWLKQNWINQKKTKFSRRKPNKSDFIKIQDLKVVQCTQAMTENVKRSQDIKDIQCSRAMMENVRCN